LEVNIDSVLEAVSPEPWDLSVQIGHTAYRIPPVTIHTLATLLGIGVKLDAQQQLEALRRCFDSNPPPDEELTPDVAQAVLLTISEYLKHRNAKNSKAIAAQVQAAMGTAIPGAASGD